MLHNTGPFGPNDVPVNVNPQSNMTSMSGRMNIGNNINNLTKIPQQSPQPTNPHFNLPDYPTYGLNMNPGLSPFQNFHHVGFQQNSMPQSSIHESWQNNMLPMNLNMQSEHSMLGFAQYGKPEVSEQSFNKSMLNVPQVHTKAFHKQMGMDVNYHYNLNPSYRPYADYNLDLTSKHKPDDVRHYIDPNIGKERLALSPHYTEQIDLSNKQKMHNFPRPYLETTTKSHISQKQDNYSILNNDLSAHLQRSKEKHSYFDNTDNVKSQMVLENRYGSAELDLSKSLKHGNLNPNYQNVSADLRFYKDQHLRPQSNENVLPKFQQPDNLNTNFSNMNSDLRIYKDHDSIPQNLEKVLGKPQQPQNLNTTFQNTISDLRFCKEKDTRPQNLENSLTKIRQPENLNTDFPNVGSEHRFHSDKSKPHSNEELLSKFQQPEPSSNTGLTNVTSDLRMYKDQHPQPQNLEKSEPKVQEPENLITNYQNINSDIRFYKDQDSRRRSLENTVKMIENILSHSSNSRKSQLTSYQSKSTDRDQNVLQKNKSDLKIPENDNENKCDDVNNTNSTAGDSSIDNISNSFNKSDESDVNTSNEMDIANENDDIDQSNDESDSDDVNKDDSTYQSDKEASNINNEGNETELADKTETDDSCSEEDVKPTDLLDENEIEQSEIKLDDKIVVKVEIVPSIVDMEHLNPFHRDIFGVQSEDTANHDIVESETSINIAKEVIRNGAKIEGAYFECPHCNLYFNRPKRFLIHAKWHSFGLTNEKRMELQKEKEMRKQMRKEARVVERMNQNEVMDANTPGRKFNCRDCDKVFVAKASLKNHRQRYHPTRVRDCKICGKTVLGWMALRTHMATHTCDSGYKCDSCPKRFKHPHSLAKHRDTHLEKTHACPQCPKKFGSVTLLNVHMKTHERALRGATFRCTYCGKGFFESYSLQVHERTHRNERPYLCEICNTSFGTNSSLKRHLKVSHSTSKPFECSTCHRSFISEAIRDRHTMRNHGNPEDFKFVCKQCPCKYLKLKDLRKHMYKVHPKGKRKKKAQSDSE